MHGDPTLCQRDAVALDKTIVNKLKAMEGTSAEFYEAAGKMRDTFAYKRLGFDQWEDYLADRTAGYSVLKRSREYLVWLLYDDGHSQRDIAEKLGVNEATVNRDLKKRKSDVLQNATPAAGVTKGRDGKIYPRPTVVPDLDEDEPLDVETDKPEEDSPSFDPATARQREKKPSPLTCDVDTWDDSYTRLSHGIDALLRNPTYLQAERVEKLIRKALIRIGKIKEEIEAVHGQTG